MDNFYNSNDNFPPQTPPYYEQPQRYQGSSSCASASLILGILSLFQLTIVALGNTHHLTHALLIQFSLLSVHLQSLQYSFVCTAHSVTSFPTVKFFLSFYCNIFQTALLYPIFDYSDNF